MLKNPEDALQTPTVGKAGLESKGAEGDTLNIPTPTIEKKGTVLMMCDLLRHDSKNKHGALSPWWWWCPHLISFSTRAGLLLFA
jgi:hypothetical protein